MQLYHCSSFILLLLLLLLCKNIPAESNLGGREVYVSSQLHVIGTHSGGNQSRSHEKSYHTHSPGQRETEAGMVSALLVFSAVRLQDPSRGPVPPFSGWIFPYQLW